MRINKIVSLFLASLFAAIGAFTPAHESTSLSRESPTSLKASAPKRSVRVGLSDTESINPTNQVNENSAFLQDYIQAVSEYANWDYHYVQKDWAELLNDLKNGDLDVLMDVSKTTERESYFDFSSDSMGTEWVCLYGRQDTTVSYNDYASFNGMTVGCEGGSTIIQSWAEFGKEHNFSFTTKSYANNAALFRGLDNKEIDAAVTNSFFLVPNDHALLAKCLPDPVYIATNKNVPALKTELDEAMSSLFAYNPSFNTDLYQYHFGKSFAQTAFTEEEKAYLATKPVINVYYETSWAPFEYDQKGVASGITPDVIRAIAKDTPGLAFNFVLWGSTQAIYQGMDVSQNDMVMAISYSYTWANSRHLLATQPYLNGSVMRVAKSSTIVPQSVATVSDGYLAAQIKNHFPALTPKSVLTFDEAMKALANGEVDCTFLNSYQASYYRSMYDYQSFSYQPVPELNQSLSLGVNENANPMLLQVLSKSLQRLSATTLQSILNDNSVYNEPATLKTILRRYPLQSGIGIGLVILLIGIAVFFLVNAEARKRQNQALALAKAEADKANAAKSEFLSRMSHDIRTPLNGIVGMTYLAEEENTSPAVKDYLAKIDLSSKFLLSLINDILDMSKAESGEIQLRPEPYPLEELGDYLKAVFAPSANAKSQDLSFVIVPEASDIPYLDHLRINQILFNLLSNAIKFTPANGTILCEIKESVIAEGSSVLEIKVQDNGIGMSEEFQKIVFEPFSQENQKEGESQKQGTGLGMAIAKKLVEVMGGNIGVDSVLGKGSTFKVSLPVKTMPKAVYLQKKATEMKNEKESHASLSGKRILLCEDNVINQEIGRKILLEKGMEVVVAKDGQEGVALFEASKDKPFDAILMDLRMPHLNGYEATFKIRSSANKDAKTIPIIAMTADAFGEDVKKCLDVGMNAHIAKPINPKLLYETLAHFIVSSKPKEQA